MDFCEQLNKKEVESNHSPKTACDWHPYHFRNTPVSCYFPVVQTRHRIPAPNNSSLAAQAANASYPSVCPSASSCKQVYRCRFSQHATRQQQRAHTGNMNFHLPLDSPLSIRFLESCLYMKLFSCSL